MKKIITIFVYAIGVIFWGAVVYFFVSAFLTAVSDAQEVKTGYTISIRDPKGVPDAPFDFLIESKWIELNKVIFQHLKLQQGFERQDGEYYWSNDYMLNMRGFGFRDFRKDDRNLHTINFSYLCDKLPHVSAGAALLYDNRRTLYMTTLWQVKLSMALYRLHFAKKKVVHDLQINFSKPLKRYFIFETAIVLIGQYYKETGFRPVRRLKTGLDFTIR